MAKYYPTVYMVYSTICLHIHPMMDRSVVSIFWLLAAVLAQTIFKKKSTSYVYFKAISVIGEKIQISKAHTDV